MTSRFLILALALLAAPQAWGWGFLAHRRINHLAVYTLPEPLRSFYKRHQGFVTEAAPNPDKRRNQDPGEAPRHYVDLDVRAYRDSFLIKTRPAWTPAVNHYSEDTLHKYGTVPWQIRLVCTRLTEAFKNHDWDQVLFQSAELGHYAADANVPLHTCENYDGQLTGQKGLHALWESRLPEQFYSTFVFLPGKAAMVTDINGRVWADILATHRALDTVFSAERKVQQTIPVEQKSQVTEKGTRITRIYSQEFSAEYHKLMHGQVERRMAASIRMVGDLWYTCWMEAGQPALPAEMGPEPPADPEPTPPTKAPSKAAMKRDEE